MRRRTRLALLASAPAALTVTFLASDADAACPGPVADFRARTPVTITNNGATALTDTFVVVTLDHAALVAANRAKPDGGDLRFTDDQCNALDFFVDGDLDVAATKVWVKIPNLAVGANTISAYSGSPAATRVNDPAPLFGTNIVALYPMTEGAGAVVHDRVGGFDLDITGSVVWEAGPRQGTFALSGFGGGRAMRTATKPAPGGGDFAVFSAIYPTTLTNTPQGILGNYADDVSPGFSFKLHGVQGLYMFLTSREGANWCQHDAPGVTVNTWQTLGAKRGAGLHTMYRNGAANGTGCAGDTRDVSTGAPGPWEIGRSYNGNFPFSGHIAFSILWSAAKSDAEMAALDTGLALGADLAVVTETTLEKAGPPTITKAEPGDEKATFTFTPPADTGGSPITGYVVSCNNGEKTVTGASSPLTLEGLTNRTTYTCVVRAVTAFGEGEDSAPIQVGPADVPGAPTNLVATVTAAGDGASLAFTAPDDDGGSPITGYVARCQAGTITKEGAGSPIALPQLAPASYSCVVAAKNASGTGPESAPATFVIAPTGSDAGASSSGGVGPSADPGQTGSSVSDDGGCGCSVVGGDDDHTPTAFLAALGALGAAVLRRRPRRR